MTTPEFPNSKEVNELDALVAELRSREEFDEVTQRIVLDWVERNKARIDQDPTGRARVEFDIDHADLYFRAGYLGKAVNIFYDLPDQAFCLNIKEVRERVADLGRRMEAKAREILATMTREGTASEEDITHYTEMIDYIVQLNTYRNQ